MSRKPSNLSTLVLLLLACAAASAAQSASPAPSPLTAQLVKTGLYVISSGEGNSVLRLSANGLIVVDGQLPANYDALRKKMKRISDQRVRVLINTNYYERHTATNARFLADGTQIIAHENVKGSLANYNPPGGKVAPPTITYAKDYTLKLGGVEARLLYFGSALTNGDTVVYFPDLKVVAVGDLFAPNPSADSAAGGSLANWAAALAQILKLDFDVVIPGTGPVVGRADLEAFRAKLVTLSETNPQLLIRQSLFRLAVSSFSRSSDVLYHRAFVARYTKSKRPFILVTQADRAARSSAGLLVCIIILGGALCFSNALPAKSTRSAAFSNPRLATPSDFSLGLKSIGRKTMARWLIGSRERQATHHECDRDLGSQSHKGLTVTRH